MTIKEGAGFECAPIFKIMGAVLEKQGGQSDLVKKINGVYGIKVTGGPDGKAATWIIDLKSSKPNVQFEGQTKPDVILEFSDGDFIDLMTGSLSPQKAFFQGKLKIKGNMGMAMKLQEISNTVKKATSAKL